MLEVRQTSCTPSGSQISVTEQPRYASTFVFVACPLEIQAMSRPLEKACSSFVWITALDTACISSRGQMSASSCLRAAISHRKRRTSATRKCSLASFGNSNMAKTVTTPWDPADHLRTDEDMAAYLEAALEGGDPNLVSKRLAAAY